MEITRERATFAWKCGTRVSIGIVARIFYNRDTAATNRVYIPLKGNFMAIVT